MNRFFMHISWIDSQIVSDTLTSIENALQYSKEPTEFLFVLNEQTFSDKPLEKTVKEQWEYFIHHPFIKKCKLEYITDDDSLAGVASTRIKYLIRDGVNYWGESDCYLPLEYFYIAENFHKEYKDRPYILTFSDRKMWAGWELSEHESVRNTTLEKLDKNIPEQAFLRCDGPISLKQLYEFNEKQSDPKIELMPFNIIPGQTNTLNSTLAILSDKMPENLVCPDLLVASEDYNIQWSRLYYKIPQFHVSNIIKGHDNGNPKKRTNIIDPMGPRSKNHEILIQNDREKISEWIKKLYEGKIK